MPMSTDQRQGELGNILITGGAGFVGCNLVHILRDLDHVRHIRVLDNEVRGNRAALQGMDVEFLHGDIRDRDVVKNAMENIDAVVHLAADTRVIDSIENPEFNFENNVIGTFNVLMAMKEAGVKRIVNASTGGAIIGDVPPPVHEEMLPRPVSPYGASKMAAEGYCSAFAGSYGIKAVSLRFANIYGPRSLSKESVVAAFFKRILAGKKLTIYGDGSQQRDYVFVSDICKGIVAALTSGQTGIFQLGSGKPTSLNELVDAIRQTVGSNYPVEVEYEDFRQGELLHTYCDISKAKTMLGFTPETSLRDGLRKTWEWFLEQIKES